MRYSSKTKDNAINLVKACYSHIFESSDDPGVVYIYHPEIAYSNSINDCNKDDKSQNKVDDHFKLIIDTNIIKLNTNKSEAFH